MLAHSRCNDCQVEATFDTGQSDGDSQPGRRTLVGVSVPVCLLLLLLLLLQRSLTTLVSLLKFCRFRRRSRDDRSVTD